MVMTYHEIHSWTLFGLVRAFCDLAVVYFLLCVSATVFIPSKILKVIGLCLPCPCSGFYGYQISDLCLVKLLVNWPRRRMYLVLQSVKTRFPFDLILINDQMGYSDRNLLTENHHVDGIPRLQSEAFCCTLSGPRLQTLADKDIEYDGKGKRVMYQRPKARILRRRRAAGENGKMSRFLLNDNCFPYEGNEARKERESVALCEREDFIPDDINESNHIDLGERTWHGFESSGSVGDKNYVAKGSSSVIQGISNTQKRGIEKEASPIQLLEQALEEEKAARASLYLELEKERAAAATAADEAIAMISRLQHDKALIEMEARQYQRVIEEKFAYDEEEMNILREILVRREIDNHVLEKEVEAYRQMGFLGKEQSEENWNSILDDCKQLSAATIYSNGDTPVIQQSENKKTRVCGSTSYNSPCLEKQCRFNEEGLHQQDNWTAKEKELNDTAPCYSDFDKNHLSRGVRQEDLEHTDEVASCPQSSAFDMELDVQDIHVIDEKLHVGDKKDERKMIIDSAASDDPKILLSPLEHLIPEA